MLVRVAHRPLRRACSRKEVLFYIPAIDRPSCRMSRAEFDETRAVPNISTAAKLPGALTICIDAEMILTESYKPPRFVRGAPVEVVGTELGCTAGQPEAIIGVPAKAGRRGGLCFVAKLGFGGGFCPVNFGLRGRCEVPRGTYCEPLLSLAMLLGVPAIRRLSSRKHHASGLLLR